MPNILSTAVPSWPSGCSQDVYARQLQHTTATALEHTAAMRAFYSEETSSQYAWHECVAPFYLCLSSFLVQISRQHINACKHRQGAQLSDIFTCQSALCVRPFIFDPASSDWRWDQVRPDHESTSPLCRCQSCSCTRGCTCQHDSRRFQSACES